MRHESPAVTSFWCIFTALSPVKVTSVVNCP